MTKHGTYLEAFIDFIKTGEDTILKQMCDEDRQGNFTVPFLTVRKITKSIKSRVSIRDFCELQQKPLYSVFSNSDLYAMPACNATALKSMNNVENNFFVDEVAHTMRDQENDKFPVITVPTYDYFDRTADTTNKLAHISFSDRYGVDDIINMVYTIESTKRKYCKFIVLYSDYRYVKTLKTEDGSSIHQYDENGEDMLFGYPMILLDSMTEDRPISFGIFETIKYKMGPMTAMRDSLSGKPYVLFFVSCNIKFMFNDYSVIRVLKQSKPNVSHIGDVQYNKQQIMEQTL